MLASRSGFSMRGIIPDNAKASTVTIALCLWLLRLTLAKAWLLVLFISKAFSNNGEQRSQYQYQD